MKTTTVGTDQCSDQMAGVPMTREELAKLEGDPTLLWLIAPLFPPDPQVTLFYRTLELLEFSPGTQANDQYTLLEKTWRGLPWAAVAIPAVKRNEAAKLAGPCSVEMSDKLPNAMTTSGLEPFPLRARRILRVRKLLELPDAELTRRFLEVEKFHNDQFDAMVRVWHRGRWWFRVESKEQAPPDAVDFMQFRNTRYVGQQWYTTDPRDPNWRPS